MQNSKYFEVFGFYAQKYITISFVNKHVKKHLHHVDFSFNSIIIVRI